jgi:glycosyltransferase involved in cell wall biosynthesis
MAPPVRVLHVCAGNLYGGVERIVATCARARQQCPSMSPIVAVCFDGRLSREVEDAGLPCHRLGPVRVSRPWTVWAARRRLERLLAAERPDAVVGHSSWVFALAAPVVRRQSAHLVLWLHDRVDGRAWTERWAAMSQPDLVISNSRFTAGTVPHIFPRAAVVVLYAPVIDDETVPVASRETLRASLGATDEDVVILMASRLEEWKGHRQLLRAIRRVGGRWRLWIAGSAQRPHEQAYATELEGTARSMEGGDRVALLGERTDVAALMRAADVYCQPNEGPEPFGIVFVEALYAGRPIVTTGMGGAREILTEDCGLLVPPGDDGALAAALERLVSDRALRQRLGQAGPARARALCDPADQLHRLRSLLHSP